MANQNLKYPSLKSTIFSSPQTVTLKLLNLSTLFDYALEA